MKRIYVFSSVLALFITFFPTFIFATNTPKAYIEDVTKYENQDNVTVSIYMENVDSNIVTLGLDLKYDTSKLEYISSKAGKDLNATIKLDENIPEESRVAIAIVSITGLKNDGLYYQITFKVKDASKDLPLELSLREASDSNGNEVKVETLGANIRVSSELKNTEIKEITQKIEAFEEMQINQLTTIEEIITSSANIEVGEDNVLTYEVEDTNIAEILNDGTIIPNQDGTTKVRVKMNEQDIGTVEVSVENGEVEKVVGTGEIAEFEAMESTVTSTSNADNKTTSRFLNNSEKQEESMENIQDKSYLRNFLIIFVIIVLIFIIFIFIKIKKGRKR